MVASTPFWWEAAPPVALPSRDVLPRCDVVIVGAGYTGLSAGLTLGARRPLSADLRQACGQARALRPATAASPAATCGRATARWSPSFGEDARRRACSSRPRPRARTWPTSSLTRIDCDFQLTGRFTGAANAAEYEGLARDADALRTKLGIEAHAVPRAEQRGVLGTDFYYGGMVRDDIGGLHPAKFHRGMLKPPRKPAPSCTARRRCSASCQRTAASRSRPTAAACRPTTSSSAPTATPTAPTAGCGAGSCRSAAASSPPRRSPTT